MIPRSCGEIVGCHLGSPGPLLPLSLLSASGGEEKSKKKAVRFWGGTARSPATPPRCVLTAAWLLTAGCVLGAPCSCLFMTGEHDDDDLGETSQADVLRELQFLHT